MYDINSLRPSDAFMRQQTNHHWFRLWLVAWPAPSHYLNQCWNIVNWTIGNKPQWNLKRNSYIFIEENAFENVVWKMASILSRPQCAKTVGRRYIAVWAVYEILSIYVYVTHIDLIQDDFCQSSEEHPFTSGKAILSSNPLASLSIYS